MDRKRKAAVGFMVQKKCAKNRKKDLLADATKCTRIKGLSKQCADDNEDSGEEAETSEWSEQRAGAVSCLNVVCCEPAKCPPVFDKLEVSVPETHCRF